MHVWPIKFFTIFSLSLVLSAAAAAAAAAPFFIIACIYNRTIARCDAPPIAIVNRALCVCGGSGGGGGRANVSQQNERK